MTVVMQNNIDSISLNCVLYITALPQHKPRQLYQSSIIQNTNGEHWDDSYGDHWDNVPVSPNQFSSYFPNVLWKIKPFNKFFKKGLFVRKKNW